MMSTRQNVDLEKRVAVVFLGLAMMVSFVSMVSAQEREELLFEEIPVVVTATKREQPITEVPVAVSVITSEEIRKSGAINIPQLLRRIPGVDVSYDCVSQYDVTIRGFNHSLAPHLLVMIDGLSVYHDFFGMVTWDWLPITMDEIERIEIVKSPISCLYGANAFSGVINIITKSPERAKGARFSTTFGEDNTYVNSFLYAQEKDNFSYRLSYGWDEFNKWNQSSQRDTRSHRVNSLLRYKFDDASYLSLRWGTVFNGEGEVTNGHWERDLDFFGYVQLEYTNPEWQLRIFWKGINGDIISGESYDLRYNVFGSKVQNTLPLGEKDTLIWGIEYKQTTLEGGEGTLTDADHTHHDYSGYLQNEYKPIESLSFLAGVRVDDQPLLETQVSPRVSVLYSLDKNHSFHCSFNKAFRSPTLYNSYYYQIFYYPPAYGGLPYEFVGNNNLDPEKVTLYEIGYRGRVERLEVNVDLFHKKIKDYIYFSVIESYFPGVPSKYSWLNKEGEATLEGGEIELRYPLVDWLKGFFNYSYQCLAGYKGNTTEINAPKHKLNAGLDAHFESGIFANLTIHHSGAYTWEENVGEKKLEPFTSTDLSVGYKFPHSGAEMLLSIFNVFNDVHREQGLIGINLDGEEIGRQVLFSLRWDW